MFLAIDVGNTNTVLGAYDGDELLDSWRIATNRASTWDDYAVVLATLCQLGGLEPGDIDAAIIASVVPAAVEPLRRALAHRFGADPVVVVGPGIRTGMKILYDNPREVGADRIVNAVAFYDKHQMGGIVVDFGTATTFDCITPDGDYLGGVICPGITISADALYRHAAKLPRVEVTRPEQVIGRNTVSSIQAGLFYGYVGLVDGIAGRMAEEAGYPVKVIATGGLARHIAESSDRIEEVDELLTIRGLKMIYALNAD